MGALHEGHVELIRRAHRHARHVVVSIFVNPTQFGPAEDYHRYPRMPEKDLEYCRAEKVSLVFAPDQVEMYGSAEISRGGYLSFAIRGMNAHLCGARRPGHFEGVLLVVNKLFHIVQPDVAIFGQKDIQQWYILDQMVKEHDHPVEMVMAPTEREPDGLARSSRNRYLSPEERKRAPMLFQALKRVEHYYIGRWSRRPADTHTLPVNNGCFEEECDRLRENNFKIDYFSMFSTPDLQPVDVITVGRTYVIALAAQTGNTRLIDNILLNFKA